MHDLADLIDHSANTYLTFQNTHPFLGTLLTAQITLPLGDLLSQIIKDRDVKWKQVRYTAGLAPIYGGLLYGLMQSGELVGDTISEHPLAKAALGPNLWGNLYNTLFFVNNTLGEKNHYSLSALAQSYAGLHRPSPDTHATGTLRTMLNNYMANIPKHEYLMSVLFTTTAWNAIQYINYAHIPETFRSPFALAFGVAWVTLLSTWSLTGRRRITATEERKKRKKNHTDGPSSDPQQSRP
ncbi:MAG: Mpv17/PMP22 family protein [Nitrosarchaeum sp.]|nr:Mpv17/PMP22 family protein [Nitrosarchaeum sp.]